MLGNSVWPTRIQLTGRGFVAPSVVWTVFPYTCCIFSPRFRVRERGDALIVTRRALAVENNSILQLPSFIHVVSSLFLLRVKSTQIHIHSFCDVNAYEHNHVDYGPWFHDRRKFM